MYILYVQPDVALTAAYSTLAEAYLAKPYAERDAGFDLYSAGHTFAAGERKMLSQQVRCAFYDTERRIFRAYWLLPRSSISKTPLRLANSVGLIDAGYRGTIMSATVNTGTDMFEVGACDRYFQLASPDLLPWDEVQIVSEIPGGETLRGSGGFGSTGLSYFS